MRTPKPIDQRERAEKAERKLESIRARMAWLQENAPVVLWRGHQADGTPSFEVLDADDNGELLWSLEGDAISLGKGIDIFSAIDDARGAIDCEMTKLLAEVRSKARAHAQEQEAERRAHP